MKENKKYWYIARAYHVSPELCSMLDRLPFEYFAPMSEKKMVVKGKDVKRNVPLALNYVFFHTDDFQFLRSMIRDMSRVTMLYHSPSRDAKSNTKDTQYRPMIANDREMEMFIKAASFYTQGAPLTVPDRKLMMKGDRVRIIDGPFKGVEGTLISQQGKDGGKVVVSIGDLVSVPTLDISPENIQVIRFAHGNKHIYKKMDSFKPRVEKALKKRSSGEELQEEEKDAIENFIKRFSSVETDTVNTEARLTMLVLLGYYALQMPQETRMYFLKLRDEILPRVKSERIKEKIQQCLGKVLL